jgi:DNA-directed RNA polymerase subunit M/transcription elongation factor TFIIS
MVTVQRVCPKCRGVLALERDEEGLVFHCYQCGLERSAVAKPLRSSTPVPAAVTPNRSTQTHVA